MYCPNCKQEFPGKFCPECGTKLIETPAQNDISLNLSDNAAVVGGINVSRNETHNNTSYVNNIVERQKSEAELYNERIQQFMQCCKQVFRNGLLIEEEMRMLETERLRLGIGEAEAERLMEMERKSSGGRMTTLGLRDATTLKNIDRFIDSNNTTVLTGQLPRLSALAVNYRVDDVQYKYYMLLAVFSPKELVQAYEAALSDEYWQTYWVAIAYIKLGNIGKAEEAIVKLSYYPEYSEDNSLLLSAISAYSEFGTEVATDYISAIFPDQCSPLLLPFAKALFLEITPERSAEIALDKSVCQFYIDNIVTVKCSGTNESNASKQTAEEEARHKAEQQSGQAVASCPNCGCTLEPGDTFCAMCGKRVGEETNASQSTGASATIQELDDIYIKAEYYFDKEEYSKAVELYSKAAEQGHPEAQFSLANCYYYGNGVEEDIIEAVRWYRKAAENGDKDAQYSLGYCYFNGEGVRANMDEAVRWYRKSAEQGNTFAQYNLGYCYYNGSGVEEDIIEAARWYRKAAEGGDSDAQFCLGNCYENGEGVRQDMNEAVKWYRKAAEQGNSSAQCNLGICYYKGQGVAEDNEQAIKWFRKAAEQEEAVAQYFIGECYENGYGVREDIDEAIKWYRKAAEQGDEDAIEKLEELENGESDSDFDEDDQKYIDLIKSGLMLAAVKEYKEDKDVSLSEAKDYIDKLKASLG